MTDRRQRTLSYSEIETALTCWARWDFAYGGRLAGSCLKPKALAPTLSQGKAWGVAVATWHQHTNGVLASWYAHQALQTELERQVKEMADAGVPAPSAEHQLQALERLSQMLDHYAATADPLPNLTMLEGQTVTGIPSRGASGRASPLYRFLCRIDGYSAFGDGHPDLPRGQYIVEFKLRQSLTDPGLIMRQRQHRWYAWALTQTQGAHAPTGVLVDERLNQEPKEPRLVQGRRKGNLLVPSHAKDQLCTPEAYLDLCDLYGIEPEPLTVESLRGRMWQQRVPIILRPDELDDAGRELRDAAKLIRDLDTGALAPIRNATWHCNRCKFREVCAEPADELYVDTLFDRTVPKRDRVKADPQEALTS